MKVRHPQYGTGLVKAMTAHAVEVRFDDGTRTVEPSGSGLQPAEPQATIGGLEMPLDQLIRQTIEDVLGRMGWDRPDTVVPELGTRWHKGKITLSPADPALQSKEIPVEVFFHKIVGIRNQLRVLEQKVNSHPQLTDGDKVEMQQYISRCYGSLTTFNLLFKDKAGQFDSGM
jgi:hypothetical protein